MKDLKLTKIKWNCVQIIICYMDDHDYVDTVNYFNLEELENEYFIELLKYFLSYGDNEYQDYFEEFIYIPKDENGKPKHIDDVQITKFEYGQGYEIEFE